MADPQQAWCGPLFIGSARLSHGSVTTFRHQSLLLEIGAGGNVRTKTMKAFDAEQMIAIIQRTG